MVFAGVVVAGSMYSGFSKGIDSLPQVTDPPAATNHLVGTFIKWEPVDEANGYAYISIKNNGSSTATAECTVRVSNDFGNFGFDFMVGEDIPAGETWTGRMALSVGEGSLLINKGIVEDC